ncbi:MAG: hypothetical protein IIB53_16575 [Planctomycetes bacterium]|nr:hypothetical protein [Planctomycetota bacterium]
MTRSRRFMGFTIVDLLILLVVVTVLISLALPTLARARGDSMVQESMANLSMLSVAHVMYAADWNGRQVTWALDDLGIYDSVQDRCDAYGCSYYDNPECPPPVLAGWACHPDFGCGLWGFWPCVYNGHNWAVNPIGFPDCPDCIDGFGNFIGLDGASATVGQLGAGQTALRANSEPVTDQEMTLVSSITSPAGWHDLACKGR